MVIYKRKPPKFKGLAHNPPGYVWLCKLFQFVQEYVLRQSARLARVSSTSREDQEMNNQAKFIAMAKRHRDQDMLASGSFQMKNGKACSVGCFNAELGNETSDFAALAESTGYPEAAHRLQEAVFECLPQEDGVNWHVQFFEKAATVTDWDRVMQLTTLAARDAGDAAWDATRAADRDAAWRSIRDAFLRAE